jgi:hypothetical protein
LESGENMVVWIAGSRVSFMVMQRGLDLNLKSGGVVQLVKGGENDGSGEGIQGRWSGIQGRLPAMAPAKLKGERKS